MILTKTLRGAMAGVYLPFGLSRLKALSRVYGTEGFFQEKFVVGGYRIEVQQSPPYQYVRVTEEGSFDFEFTTTGKPVETDDVEQEGVDLVSYKAATVKCSVSETDGTIKTAPVIVNGTRILGADNSTVKRQFQIQLINEPVSYPRGQGRKFPIAQYQTYAPSHAHTGIHLRNTSWGFDSPRFQEYDPGIGDSWMNPWVTELNRTRTRGSLLTHLTRDMYYDVPYMDGNGTAPVRTAYIRGDADWPRAMGNQVVEDETHGSRQFAIYVDAFNKFWVFPTAQIEAPNPLDPYAQNVDAMYVKNPTVTLPPGGYAPTMRLRDYFPAPAAEALVDFPELDWRFNHTGTKAATILYSRSPFDHDAAYFAADPGALPFDAAAFVELRDQLGVQGRQGLPAFAPSHNTQRYFVAPGVIEATIEITLTGPDPEDFDVEVNVAVVRDPATDEYCTLSVDYAWHNIPDPAGGETPAATPGDLLVVDVEQWATAGETELPVSLMSVKNLDTSTELLCISHAVNVMAVDLRTLSFALRVDNQVIEFLDKTAIGGYASSRWETLHFCVALLHKLKVKDTLFPESMDEPNRATLAGMVATLGDGAAARSGRYMVPLNEARDWSDTDFASARDYMAQPGVCYNNASGPSLTPAIEAVLNLWYWEYDTLNPASYLIYCDAPKFGWHVYADLLCRYLNVNTSSTFYAHPNGTICFFDNSQLYNPQGAGNDTDIYSNEALGAWDPELLEHCIFDRVYLRMNKGAHKTTFQSLYNRAVQNGVLAGSLVDDFDEIAPEDMRCAFSKTEVLFGEDFNDRAYLQIDGVWDGVEYHMQDPGVQGGGDAGGTFIVAPFNTSIETNFNQAWTDEDGFTTAPTKDNHIRFANPMVIMAA